MMAGADGYFSPWIATASAALVLHELLAGVVDICRRPGQALTAIPVDRVVLQIALNVFVQRFHRPVLLALLVAACDGYLVAVVRAAITNRQAIQGSSCSPR
jgi:hypothetical protein